MAKAAAFEGFPAEAVSFLEGLANNNTKSWFTERKETWRDAVIAPARELVAELGERLAGLHREAQADPRTNGAGSIFRIYRDVRFSKDKSPYKTHLGILFWVGAGKKMERPGFYFHLEPPELMLAAGSYQFTRPALEDFRQAVVDRKRGAALARAVKKVTESGAYELGGSHYKRIPPGFDKEHPNAALLLHNGLYAWTRKKIPKALYSKALVDYAFQRFSQMNPVMNWLLTSVYD